MTDCGSGQQYLNIKPLLQHVRNEATLIIHHLLKTILKQLQRKGPMMRTGLRLLGWMPQCDQVYAAAAGLGDVNGLSLLLILGVSDASSFSG